MDIKELKPGFTWRSALALLMTSLVFTPISIYIQLVAGVTSIPAIAIVMAILFSEIARLSGNPLSRQELFIIYQMSVLATGATTCYLYQVQKSYFVTSPLAWSFRLNGVPIPELVPPWWAPPFSSEAYVLRTFIHPHWLIPLLVVNIQAGLFYYLVELSLAVMMSYLYIEVEKLPFPLAPIDASLVTTLSEREPTSMKLFILSMYPGLAWGAVLYLLPSVTGIVVVPLPWIDLTPWTSKWIPGALLGVMTDLSPYLSGFFIPFHVACYMVAASIAVWVFGNNLALTAFKAAFPEWVKEYFQGMSLMEAYARSLLRVWVVPQIAFAYAAMVVVLIFTGKSMARAIATLSRLSGKGVAALYPSVNRMMALYLAGSLGSVVLFHILVPDFPVWIALILSLVVSLLNALISTRSIGETGYSISIPYEWYTAVYLTGYRNISAWIFQPVIGGIPGLEGGAPYWAYMVKVAYLTQTRPMDVFKALVFNIIMYNIFSFVWTEFFWRIAPIPSSAYPYTVASWPAALISSMVWMTGEITVKPWLFTYSFGGMAILLLAGELMARFAQIPFSSMGVLTGAMSTPPFTMPVFIGSFLNRFVMPRLLGRERWESNKTIITAGLVAGEGIIAGVGIALTLLSKATWIKPW